MKRLILIFSFVLLLTSCGKTEELPVVSEEVLPFPAPTEEVTPPVEVETTVVVPKETVIADGGNIVHYTSEMVEGLVEDTVGYTFEIPTFDAEGAEAIRTYYENLAAHLEGYTKETVYAEAASRGCIVSVYGYVTDAVLDGDVLTVSYTYECDFSDTEESTENIRTDSFSAASGEIIDN